MMRAQYIALGTAILAVLVFSSIAPHSQSVVSNTSMGVAINYTESYINYVNRSGYLVFYPDLTQAYSYLSLAKNQSGTNASYSYYLLSKARASAQAQETSINQYKTASSYALAIFGVILFVLLYIWMRPLEKRKK